MSLRAEVFETLVSWAEKKCFDVFLQIYRVIQNDYRGFNNLSYTIRLRYEKMYFLFNRTTLQVFVTYLTGALYVHRL